MFSNSSYFDSVTAKWDDNPKRVEMARAIVNAIKEKVHLSSKMDMLDYGCGTGLFSVLFSSQVGHITGADSSAGMIRTLQKKIIKGKINNLEVMELDLEHIPAPPSRYHLVVSGMAMHHIKDVRTVIKAFYELLLPGGHL